MTSGPHNTVLHTTVEDSPRLSTRHGNSLPGFRGMARTCLDLLPTFGIVAALLVSLIITAWFTGWNMLHYPHYEIDEGTYVNSAWALFNEGRLADYTYGYGHPPFGWLMIALWAMLTGGYNTFGMAINSGRVFMFVLTLVSCGLIFLSVHYTTKRTAAAMFAAIAFAVTPLAVVLHRQVYLDNIATMWMLLAVYLLLTAEQRLGHIVWSAIAFGLMFWSKEVLAALLPAMLFLVYAQAHPLHRRFAIALWLSVAIAISSLFVLLAVLKSEFLPPGALWSSSKPHVSFLDTYFSQVGRGGNGSLFSKSSDFQHFFQMWSADAWLLIVGGLGATALGLLAWKWNKSVFGVSLLNISYILFLGRGGVVLFFYFIPVIALLALELGLILGYAMRLIAFRRWVDYISTAIVVVLTVVLVQNTLPANTTNFSGDNTTVQVQAARWIVDNLPRDSFVIMDSYAWTDLRDPRFTNGQPFTKIHFYWPAALDPEIRDGLLNNDWHNIDYLVLSLTALADIHGGSVPLVAEALKHSDLVRSFSADKWLMNIYRVRHLKELTATQNPMLTKTWASYKTRFISNGRVIEHDQTAQTTSEGQAYAMLQAVYMDDRDTFDALWQWTYINLRRADGLLSWQYGKREDGTPGVRDVNSATDADQDAALALLFAAHRWNEPSYQQAAQHLIASIWQHETAEVKGRRVVVAGNWAATMSQPIVNPSYFAPYAYRIFAEVDPEHNWKALVGSTYDILAQVSGNTQYKLPPNWVQLDLVTGEASSAAKVVQSADLFSYDANRIPWRIALDWMWLKDNRAYTALTRMDSLWQELMRQNRLFAEYKLDGTPAATYESLSMYAGTLPGLLVVHGPEAAAHVFSEKVLSTYRNTPNHASWGSDPNNYYDQNLAWFAAAVMDGSMANLWAGETVLHWDDILSK